MQAQKRPMIGGDAAFQPRVLSSAHAGRNRTAPRHAPPVEAAQARVLLGHVRRRRLDARRHARGGARVPRRRHAGSAAYLLHGRHAALRSPKCSRNTRRTTSAISSRCAAICRRERARPAISGSRASSSPSSGKRPATGFISTSPPIPNAIRRPARCRKIWSRSSARSTPEPIRRSPSTSTIPMRTGTSSTRAARRGSPYRSSPASCRSAATRSSRAFRKPAARKSRAGSARSFEGYGDDIASIRAFGLDVVTDLADALLARGAPGLHFYTLNQAALTTTIWQRLGL